MIILVILEVLYSMSTRLVMASLMRVNFIVVLTGLCILSLAQTDKLTIPIGAIFKPDDYQAEIAFRYAVSKFNSRNTNPFALAAYIDNIDVADSFTLASIICDRMAEGVFLFYGVKDMTSLDIVQSFTRTFHMPFLSPSTPSSTIKPGPTFEIHMKPEFAYAIIDMILHFEWRKIHYLYDSDEGLRHIQLVLSTLRQISESGQPFRVSVLPRRIHNIRNAHDELRQLDRSETDPTLDKIIVFDLSSEEAYRLILKQIPEVGMNKEGYRYLVATMDFANVDMGRYLHGGVNITGFQLLDPESKQLKEFMDSFSRLDRHTYPGAQTQKLTYESALAVDAIEVITRTLKSMLTANKKIFKSTFRRKEVYNYNRTKGVPCTTNPPIPWMHGDAIMDEIKRLEFDGLTGTVMFDEEGYRWDYKLDVYTVGLDNGPTKIGSWSQIDKKFVGLNNGRGRGHDDIVKKRVKIVTTILSPPFLMLRGPDKDGNIPVGNERFDGYVYDLAEYIADIVNIEYQLVPTTEYGEWNEENETWSGMVGQLYERKADFCIAPLTITYDREMAIDFTKPFMNFGISIMIKKPEITKPGVFSFMEPLSPMIWICIVFAYCGVSVGLFLVSRWSPYEWESGYNAQQENKFNVLNSLWFTMGALMLQGSDACPRSFSGRVIGTVWWFFVLIIISSYTANLAAFLTIEHMQTPIESADDLANQDEIKYGTVKSGSTKTFFKNSNVSTYQRMWSFMSSHPNVFVDSVPDGVDKVRKAKGKYAFLLESPSNEYLNSRDPCDTWKVGPELNSKGFGIATPKGSSYRDKINLAVLVLIEDGTLHKLKTKWWKDKGECSDAEESGKRELSLSNVAGIFYILIAGLVFAIVLASAEFLFKKSKLIEKTPYMKATETAVTLVSSTPTTEKENGCYREHPHFTVQNCDKEEATFSYGYSPPSIGFEHFMYEQDHTDL